MSLLLASLRFTASNVYPAKINLSSTNSTFYAKNLVINKSIHLKTLPPFDVENLVFGKQSSDHMMMVDWDLDLGWNIPKILPLETISVHPFNSSLHYAVQCFEGMKAYKNKQGQIRLFRPECNILRLKKSSKRISLPDFDGEEFLKIITEYVKVEQRWIPTDSEYSLYLRPVHISMENSLGVKNPTKSKLMLLGSPLGPYYPTGFQPVSLSCGVGTIRSAPGGTGAFKIGANYCSTLVTSRDAIKKGHQQILWLFNDTKIIQVGASNIFFVFKGKDGKKAEIVTPALEDLILPGVTRDSIIEYLKTCDQYDVTERQIHIEQVLQKNKKGELLQCFSSGTAVVVGSVKNIEFKGQNYPIFIDPKLKAGPITAFIRQKIVGIQQGRIKDPFGWSKLIN